jgi:hypothetical protein
MASEQVGVLGHELSISVVSRYGERITCQRRVAPWIPLEDGGSVKRILVNVRP